MISHLISITISINLPSYPSNQRLINRVRQEVQPKIENDKTLKITLPKELKRTHSNEAFLHFETGEDDPERILIFARTDNFETPYITQIRGTAMVHLACVRETFSNFTLYKPSLKEA